MSEIGFIGLGSMGRPMARHLLDAGYALRVYNRTAEKARGLEALGARIAAAPDETAEPDGLVLSMVSDDGALREVVFGDHGLGARLGRGGVHVSLSTISPELSRELAGHHAERGAAFVAAPVFGRPDAAEARKLWICFAGDGAAKARARPALEALGQGLFDFGDDPAAASVLKLAGNFLIAAALEAMGEAFAFTEKAGLERGAVADLFAQTLFACPVYQSYGRLIAEERYAPPGLKMSLGLKDMGLALDAARKSEVPLPLASLVHDRMLAAAARGRGELDWAAVGLGASEDAGLRPARCEDEAGDD